MYLDAEGINKLVADYEKDTKALKEELFRICWYMRGGLTLNESYLLTPEDRVIVGEIIESNLETTKKTGLSFF